MANMWVSIIAQGVAPLLAVHGVFPAGLLAGNELLGIRLEGNRAAGLELGLDPLRVAILDRILTGANQSSGIAGRVTRLGERYVGGRSQPHIALFARRRALEPKNPAR